MHCYDLYNAILFLAFNIQLRELDGDSNSSVIMLVQPQLRDLDRDSNCCARSTMHAPSGSNAHPTSCISDDDDGV